MPRRRGARKRKKNQDNSNAHKKKRQESWTPWVTENKLFEEYYRNQGIMNAEQDFVPFLKVLKEELPTTLRVNEASQFKNMVKSKFAFFSETLRGTTYLPSPDAPEEVPVEPPLPIPWFPPNGRLNSGTSNSHSAWQFSMARRFLNQKESTLEFRNFLIMHHALGTIARQELVSMIPPLFLDVQPHHYILDMCAAPGSKTTQIIEHLHQMGSPGSTALPSGYVIANDAEPQRCHTLATQLKRLGSPCILVTNHRAQYFPLLYTSEPSVTNCEGKFIDSPSQLLFDRILCDVPCSGDGTLRKNPDIWVKWNPLQCISLHRMQSSILWRAFEILKVGGRIVYSTCSLNPIEDEAVIAGILVRANGALTLIDIGEQLPGLKRRNGISSWRVMDKQGNWYEKFEQLPEHLKKFPQTVFPPDQVHSLNLDRCFRILPHDQNTGGFFVAVLEKTLHTNRYRRPVLSSSHQKEGITILQDKKTEIDPMESDNSNTISITLPSESIVPDIVIPPLTEEKEKEENEEEEEEEEEIEESISSKREKQRKTLTNPEQLFPLPPEVIPYWDNVRDLFGMNTLPYDNLLARLSTSKDGLPQKIYFLPTPIKDLTNNPYNHKIKVLNSGIKVFQRLGAGLDYRICQEGLLVLLPYITKRIVQVTKEELKILLTNNELSDEFLHEETSKVLQSIEMGPCVFAYKDDQCSVYCTGSRGKTNSYIFLRNNEKNLILQALFPEHLLPKNKDTQISKKRKNISETDHPTDTVPSDIDPNK